MQHDTSHCLYFHFLPVHKGVVLFFCPTLPTPLHKKDIVTTDGALALLPACNPSSLSCRASLWSSCVVLPLLALTWMSAVLAMTDKRSILFQVLFAVFDSLQGFVIVMVHCILRREVMADFKASRPNKICWWLRRFPPKKPI